MRNSKLKTEIFSDDHYPNGMVVVLILKKIIIVRKTSINMKLTTSRVGGSKCNPVYVSTANTFELES